MGETLYGFSNADVGRIGSAVRRVESSGGSRVNRSSRHKEFGQGVGDSYAGHFKVTDSSDESANDADVSSGVLVLGLTTVEVDADVYLEIESDGYLYLNVGYDEGYEYELMLSATWPTQDIDNYCIVLAYIDYTAPVAPVTVGSIKITQLHYGVHYGAGRVF